MVMVECYSKLKINTPDPNISDLLSFDLEEHEWFQQPRSRLKYLRNHIIDPVENKENIPDLQGETAPGPREVQEKYSSPSVMQCQQMGVFQFSHTLKCLDTEEA